MLLTAIRSQALRRTVILHIIWTIAYFCRNGQAVERQPHSRAASIVMLFRTNSLLCLADQLFCYNLRIKLHGGNKKVALKKRDEVYILPKLAERLPDILAHPLTLVEAGSGFGKTTAVGDFTAHGLPAGAVVYSHTFLGEPPASAWQALCALIARVDATAGAKLTKMTEPTLNTLSYISSAVSSMTCSGLTLLIMDNYQQAGFEIPFRLLSALALHNCPELHIVVLTQPLPCTVPRNTLGGRICLLSGELFCFDLASLRCYLEKSGLRPCREEIEQLLRTTSGWIAAIRLQIDAFRNRGSFAPQEDIAELFASVVWDRLTVPRREEAMRLALPENFTVEQAAVMLNRENLAEADLQSLREDPFIRLDRPAATYTFHPLLRTFLLGKLAGQSAEFRRNAMYGAARGAAARGDLIAAAGFYVRLGDHKAVFELPFSRDGITKLLHGTQTSVLEMLVVETPPSVLERFPEHLINLALEFFLRKRLDLFARCQSLLRECSETEGLYDEAKQRQVRGETELIKMFVLFNDAEAMSEVHRKAWEILGGPIRYLKFAGSGTFGISSAVCMYWRDSGRLAQTLATIKEGMKCYAKLYPGHGSGVIEVMKAEMALLGGRDEEATEQAALADYLAQKDGQDCLRFCALLVQARAALLQGDAGRYKTAAGRMKELAFTSPDPYSLITEQLCAANMSALLDIDSMMPQWILSLKTVHETVPALTVPFALIPCARIMLTKNPPEFRALAGELIAECEAAHMLLPQVYLMIFRAVERAKAGDWSAAVCFIKQALAIAVPDRVFLPFAGVDDSVAELLSFVRQPHRDQQSIDEVLALVKRLSAGVKKVRAALGAPRTAGLTPRELQVAKLLKEGMTTKEIADHLSLKFSSVNSLKESLYLKLDVHSLIELSKTAI